MHPFEFWRHWIDANTLALDANCVIAMRMARFAGGQALSYPSNRSPPCGASTSSAKAISGAGSFAT